VSDRLTSTTNHGLPSRTTTKRPRACAIVNASSQLPEPAVDEDGRFDTFVDCATQGRARSDPRELQASVTRMPRDIVSVALVVQP